MSSSSHLNWRYHIDPRPHYVAFDVHGHFEIVDKHWFFAFVSLDEEAGRGGGIRWRAAASLADAQAQCELLRQQMTQSHDQDAFTGFARNRPDRPLDDDSTMLTKCRKRGAGEPTPPKSHIVS